MKITIVTPAYNRANLIDKAYNSLVKQRNKSFEWIVVDDGSTDNTKEVIKKFIKENKIEIHYYKKENGGKHTAVNLGVDKANGELVLILDSDDYLVEDAIETIMDDWKKYEDNEKICGLSYKRKLINAKEDKTLKQSPYISNHIQCRHNEGNIADRAEVYRTEIMRKYKFPVFGKERFLSEGIVWNSIAKIYDTVYIEKRIVVCEYIKNGLTDNSQKLRINNPKGATENYRIMMKKPFVYKLRIKFSILYNIFCDFDNVTFKERIDKENKFLIIVTKPLGDIIYKIWKNKYL